MSLAEETGLIVPSGRVGAARGLPAGAGLAGGHPELDLSIAVNISGRQLQERDIVDATRQALAQSPGSTRRAWSSRSPRACSCSRPRRRWSGCSSSRRWASSSRSTTSAPATRRSATCAASRSTSSRSRSRSWTTSAAARSGRRSPARSSGLSDTLKLRTIAEGDRAGGAAGRPAGPWLRARPGPLLRRRHAGPRPARAARAPGAGCRLADA